MACIIAILVLTGERKIGTSKENQPTPERITVRNNEIVVEYSDGSRIEEYVPPEGRIEIVLDRKEADAPAHAEVVADVSELSGELGVAESITTPDAPVVRIVRYTPEIKIRTRGLTARPFIGAGYNGKFSPLLGIKFAYLGKLGIGLATTNKEYGFAATYRLQGWLAIVHNLELAVVAGKQYTENSPGVFVGLATTF